MLSTYYSIINYGPRLYSRSLGLKHLCLIFFGGGGGLKHMEVPRLGVESELQLPVCATATATQCPSHVCDLHHSSQ